jgi:hypothetical protein
MFFLKYLNHDAKALFRVIILIFAIIVGLKDLLGNHLEMLALLEQNQDKLEYYELRN